MSPAGARPAFLARGGAFRVIAHRGGGGLAPENTLPAIENAVALQADAVELDLHTTADGVLVACHDPTVDRTSDGEGPIRDLAFDELRRLDAGYAFSPDGGVTHPFRGQGVRFPSLAEVARATGELGMSVELKEGDVQAAKRALAVIRELGLERRICVGAFHHAPIAWLRRAAPDVATAATRREVRRFYLLRRLGFARWTRDRADAYAVPERAGRRRVVTPGAVRALHARDIGVHVWTVNDEADMRRLVEWGVDGLITDHPDRALALRHSG